MIRPPRPDPTGGDVTPTDLLVDGHRLRLAGSTIRIDAGPAITIGARERQVLDALVERSGAVVSKRDLLRAVWGNKQRGVHVVEVTVARLRQRLGPAATGVETVIRRGYRIRLG